MLVCTDSLIVLFRFVTQLFNVTKSGLPLPSNGICLDSEYRAVQQAPARRARGHTVQLIARQFVICGEKHQCLAFLASLLIAVAWTLSGETPSASVPPFPATPFRLQFWQSVLRALNLHKALLVKTHNIASVIPPRSISPRTFSAVGTSSTPGFPPADSRSLCSALSVAGVRPLDTRDRQQARIHSW